ncbi:MAG: FprA family A-type flavoprotein, partial [Pygmaiobacter sp.]
GPVWRENIDWFIEKYTRWSSYTPEEHTVMIAYASVYGNTENAVNILAGKLAEGGVRNIKLYDVSAVHPSVIVSEAFRCSHLVFASTTYNGGIFCNMETVLRDLKSHGLQNRTVALLQNGSWAATSGALMRAVFDSMKDMRVLNAPVSIKSSVKAAQLTEISALSKAILTSLRSPALAPVQPACDETTPHGYICKICGYRYEGDVLPADFICPICKHGAADFERF